MKGVAFDAAYVERVIHEIFLADIGDWERLAWGTNARGGRSVRLMVNCNDTFHFAFADCEIVEPEDLDRLVELMREEDARNVSFRDEHLNIDAELLWVTEKRQMRPLRRIWERVNDEMRERMPYPERTAEDEG